MHYKNGREARAGDPVIFPAQSWSVNKTPIVGTLHSLNPGATSCNGQVAHVVPGAVYHSAVTIGEGYHAEDALKALEPKPAIPSIADATLVSSSAAGA